MQDVVSNSSPLIHLAKIGKLLRAKRENKIESFSQIIEQIMATGFRIDAKLRNKLLAEAGELSGDGKT